MGQTIALIDYGSGNMHSAAKALERVSGPSARVQLTRDPRRVAEADALVLPGVGAFGDCRAGLLAIEGLFEAIETAVQRRSVPFLGICVGMQLMAEQGLEHGRHEGFAWVKGSVTQITPQAPPLPQAEQGEQENQEEQENQGEQEGDRAQARLKVPHMGWNRLTVQRDHPVLAGLAEGAFAYFVHSYALSDGIPEQCLATTAYGGELVAVAGQANYIGTQFHPEKSQATGLRLLENFLRWRPE